MIWIIIALLVIFAVLGGLALHPLLWLLLVVALVVFLFDHSRRGRAV